MAEAAEKRYAVVTGANKGIGLGTVKELASNGVIVVLTARDEKKGLEAVGKLAEEAGLSDLLVFHQLDVTDPSSISSLADFVKTKFGKLDILVNNAGVPGGVLDHEAIRAALAEKKVIDIKRWGELVPETYESATKCVKTNYYGAKEVTEALLPLLKLSDSPMIVNVSSYMGKLMFIPSEWAKGVLSDVENLTEEKIDQVLSEFQKDLKEDSLELKGWPTSLSSYIVSKASLNAYTRVLAKKLSNFRINCVNPGFVKTDINSNAGVLTIEEGAQSVVKLALLPNGGPTGLFFDRQEELTF